MNDAMLFFRGVMVGFMIAAPVGPIGVLCIQRTLTLGKVSGLITGLGAATADAIYGGFAGVGIALNATVHLAQQVWFHVAGGLFLCYLGVRTCRTHPPALAPSPNSGNLLRAYATTLLLTLTNPLTVFSFAAVFAVVGVGSTDGSKLAALELVLGVFCGSALWFLVLSGGVSLFRRFMTHNGLVWVNRISGSVVIACGVLALFTRKS